MKFIKQIFAFLFSTPWGLLLPLTGAVLLLIFYVFELSTKEFARQLAAEVETTPDDEIEKITEKLGTLGKYGVPELVSLLRSPRRVVVFAARDTLETEFQNWSLQSQEKSAPLNLILVRSLVAEVDSFGPTSKSIAISFVRRVMQNMLNSGDKTYNNQMEIACLCEELLDKTEPERIVRNKPQLLDSMHKVSVGGEPRITFSPDIDDVRTLVAANIERQRQFPASGVRADAANNSNSAPDSKFFDPYSSGRAEELYAVYQSRIEAEKSRQGVYLNSPQSEIFDSVLPGGISSEMPNALPGGMPTGFNSSMLAENGVNNPNVLKDQDISDQFLISDPAARIASQFGTDSQMTENSSSEEKNANDPNANLPQINQRLPKMPAYQALENKRSTDEKDANAEIPVEKTPLGQTPINEIGNLSTTDLMRLLQHPDMSIQAVAEKQLRNRDKYQDAHILLAYRLHNPNPQLRREVVDLLQRSPNVPPIPWLEVLLRDSDPQVRMYVIAYIATARDTKMVRDIIERAKKDDNPQVRASVDLIEKAIRMP